MTVYLEVNLTEFNVADSQERNGVERRIAA